MASTYEKMTGGELYCCSDESLMRLQAECLEKLYDYNATRPSQRAEREREFYFKSRRIDWDEIAQSEQN